MDERYDAIEENKSIDKICAYSVYPKLPRLIRGLKERCLCRLIKPEDLLYLRIVPVQKEAKVEL